MALWASVRTLICVANNAMRVASHTLACLSYLDGEADGEAVGFALGADEGSGVGAGD